MRIARDRLNGFTLIELILVMVILVILASIMVPGVSRYRDRANLAKVRTDVKNLETCLGAFQIDCGRFPTNDEGLGVLVNDPGIPNWDGPYVKLVPSDPWGTPYVYQAPGPHFPKSFDLSSIGADKSAGTEDDLGNWQS